MKTQFTETEWFGVAKLADPKLTKKNFKVMWSAFMKFKSLPKTEQASYLKAM